MTKSDNASELVFVYGTLRRGGSNAFRMEGAEFVGEGEVRGKLYVISWYPGLVPDSSDQWVTGDVFSVRPGHLRKLDEFEGLAAGELEGSEYRRDRMKVYAARLQNPLGEAWVWQWIGPVDENKVVRSGDWMDFEKPRPAPLFTTIATCSVVSMPVGLVAIIVLGNQISPANRQTAELITTGLLILPWISLLAVYFGQRRKEKWRLLRWLLSGLAAIPFGISVTHLVRWFVRWVG